MWLPDAAGGIKRPIASALPTTNALLVCVGDPIIIKVVIVLVIAFVINDGIERCMEQCREFNELCSAPIFLFVCGHFSHTTCSILAVY